MAKFLKQHFNVKHKYEIEKPAFPVDGYNYNVKVLISIDGGENFYYCGIGKFCKTEEEAAEYIEQHKKENPDGIYRAQRKGTCRSL